MSVELTNATDYINWLSKKVYLNNQTLNAKTRFIKRGQVYWCEFGINIGNEISKLTPRPAVIVQNHKANVNSGNTIVVPITHSKASLPCMVSLGEIFDDTGNKVLDGQVNTSNIVCISKVRLGDYITTLPKDIMKNIDVALAKSLELMGHYKKIVDKNKNLSIFCEKIKVERNSSQNAVSDIIEKNRKIKEIITNSQIDENIKKSIVENLTT